MPDNFKLSARQRYDLRYAVKAYRQRLNYAIKHGIDESLLPKPIKIGNIEANIKSKSDYEATLQKLDKINIASLRAAQQKLTEKNWLSEYRGSIIDIVGTSGKQGRFPTETKLLVKDLESKQGANSYEKLQNWIGDNRRIADQYKQRYLQGTVTKMEEAVAAHDYDAFKIAKALNKFVDNTTLDEFMYVMISENDNVGFRFIYAEGGRLGDQMQSILDSWTRALGGV